MSLPDGIQENQLHSAARAYAGLGWPVFPAHTVADGRCTCDEDDCEHIGKHPLTSHGVNDANTDLETIDRWWREAPPANVAIRTGPESAVWVLDVDGPEGLATLADLEAKHGSLPRTPTARTGKGGKHYYFAWMANAKIRSRAELDGKPIDTRGLGGYVIAPPSLHASGKHYEWEISPEEAPPAEAPDWLLDLVTTAASGPGCQQGPAGNGEVTKLRVVADDLGDSPGTAQGRRHADALRLVGSALGRGQPADIVEDQAVAWAARCKPPFPEAEIRRIVRDLAAKQAARSPDVDKAASNTTEWEPPITFDESELPPFPTAALANWQRRFVAALAIATQTPEELPGMLVLGVNSVACARIFVVQVNDGYREPLNIYIVICLPSANRKSQVFQDCCAPLSDYERRQVKNLTPQIVEATARQSINQERLAKLQKDAAKAGAKDHESVVQQATDLARSIAETEIPSPPRLLAEDVTAEKVKSLLYENGGRLAIMSPEAEVLDLMAGRYGNRGTSNFGVYINAHSGDDIRVDRVGRRTEFVKSPALTMCLTVQPDVIQGLSEQKGFRGRGLLARFSYSMAKTLVGRRETNPPPVPAAVREEYARNVQTLLGRSPGQSSCADYAPYELTLSPEAERLRLDFAAWLEPQLDPTAELGHINDWAGKLAGQVLRIAGNLHLADHVDEKAPWEKPIAEGTMQRAITIGLYLIDHARAAFSLMGSDPVIADARYILAWITRTQKQEFTRRDLFEGTKGRFKEVRALALPLEFLIRHGYIRERDPMERSGPGRKPSTTFEVNPLIPTQNSQNSRFSSLGSPDLDFAKSANTASGSSVAEQPRNISPCEDHVMFEEGII
jgi:hypothetical protein